MVNYNRLERPVQNDSAPIVVELGLTLLQIIDVVSVKERRKKKKKSEAFCFGGQYRASKRKLNWTLFKHFAHWMSFRIFLFKFMLKVFHLIYLEWLRCILIHILCSGCTSSSSELKTVYPPVAAPNQVRIFIFERARSLFIPSFFICGTAGPQPFLWFNKKIQPQCWDSDSVVSF